MVPCKTPNTSAECKVFHRTIDKDCFVALSQLSHVVDEISRGRSSFCYEFLSQFLASRDKVPKRKVSAAMHLEVNELQLAP